MDNQLIVVIDQPPLERPAWVGDVFAQCGLVEADPRAIGALVKADPDGAKALRETYLRPDAQEQVAPWYRKAFDTLHGADARVGIYGGGWLNLLAPDVTLCIVDWSGMAQITPKMAQTLTPQEIEETQVAGQSLGRAYVQERAALMPQTTFEELDGGLDDAARIAQAVAAIRDRAG